MHLSPLVPKQLDCFLKGSRVQIDPVAHGERRIDAGQVPKRIRRAVYPLLERDRKRKLGRAATPRRRSPAHGEPLAHPPRRLSDLSPCDRSNHAMMKTSLALAFATTA